ncbi:MAG TPA: rhomboid family intramembrane serine protease [Tepidisphaeraceae bacterium]|jgi:membrane associated rhomboid family serine protease
MLKISCQCGARLQLPDEHLNRMAACPRCNAILRATSAGGDIAGFESRLLITEGPERVGEQILLGGEDAITLGKSDDATIRLGGMLVSRRHCRLIPTIDGGWCLEDTKSTNGVAINHEPISCENLHDGDRIRIGEYVLMYQRDGVAARVTANATEPAMAGAGIAAPDAMATAAPAMLGDDDELALETEAEGAFYDLSAEREFEEPKAEEAGVEDADIFALNEAEPPPIPVSRTVLPRAAPQPVIPLNMPGPKCPCCNQQLAPGAKICVSCGIDIKTGRALVTSRGLDEEKIETHASIWIRFISWFMPIGVLPIASEAFGTRKPYVVWGVTVATIVVSLAYLPMLRAFERGDSEDGILLMQWSGDREQMRAHFEKTKQELKETVKRELAQERFGTGRRRGMEDRRTEREINAKIDQYVAAKLPPRKAEFHWYQLLTSGLLHGGFLHLAGNLLFMLIFGLRVNELIGNAKMAIVYPLLMVTSAASHHIMYIDQPLAPYLGASGAIMGLAGMYFVLFPAQKVHMIAWFRILVIRGWKVFRMRGFWMLLLWIAWNDVLPTALKSQDHVAHWAHLGGFVSGALLAIALLLARMVSARGTDLLSVVLGKRAWDLMGKPAELAAI